MKKRSVFLLAIILFSCFTIHAQTAKLGIKGKRSEGELQASNPKIGNADRYFKSIPFTVKAGQGVVFFMQSNSFTPLVFLAGASGKTFGVPHSSITANGKETRVAFTGQTTVAGYTNLFTPGDSTFQVIFTSYEDNATGKFIYGFNLLDSVQMIYSENFSLCARLIYLINHWQAGWDIIPESTWSPFPHTGSITKCTLMPDKTGSSLTTGTGSFGPSLSDKKASYSERMFQSKTDRGQDFFVQVVKDIRECLGETSWVFETESQDDEKGQSEVSYFYPKNRVKDQPHASFRVIWRRPFQTDALYQYEIHLVFN